MAETATQKNKVTEVKAFARDLRIAPRKMRLVTNMVKGKPVSEAITQLQFTNKKGAPMLVKLLRSAVANAEHNFSLDPETLFIKSITCNMGQVMGRYFPRARGSAFVIRRKMCHVSVTLEPKASLSKKSRFSVLAKQKKADEEKKTENVAQEESAGKEAAKERGVRDSRTKSSESVKTNKIQQKRRMFNRKSGE